MIKARRSTLVLAFVLLALVLLNISNSIPVFQEQKKTSSNEEYSVLTASDPNDFISVWDTTQMIWDSSGSDQVCLPLESSGKYNFTVYWGDGSSNNITKWNQSTVTHTYTSEGIYTINIAGIIIGWQFNDRGDRWKILEILQWGCLRLGNSGNYFYGCSNLKLTATDNLNLIGTNNLYQAFRSCANLGNSGNMNGWDVSSVTNMEFLFTGASSFNQPIDSWDV